MARQSLLTRWQHAIVDSNLDGTAKLVALVLSRYMNLSGWANPGKARLAAGASLGQGRRAVDEAVKRLEARGFLEPRREATLGRWFG